jgi:hypothetical protein
VAPGLLENLCRLEAALKSEIISDFNVTSAAPAPGAEKRVFEARGSLVRRAIV